MSLSPSRVVLSHSYEPGAEPDPEFLRPGEVALNAADHALFYLDSTGALVRKSLQFDGNISEIVDGLYGDKILDDASIVDGELILTFLDNSTRNLGSVVGPEGRGIGFDGVVEFADQLPLPGGASGRPVLPSVLDKSGTTFLVTTGTTSGAPFSNGVGRLYVYNQSLSPVTARWVNSGILQGPAGATGATGAQGPQGLPGQNGLISNVSGIPGAVAITNIVRISQANFDALATVDPNTTYIIVP